MRSRLLHSLYLGLSCSVAFPTIAYAQDNVDARRAISIPVFINNVPAGTVPGLPSENTISVQRDAIAAILESRMDEDALAPLRDAPQEFISIEQLGDLGIDAAFDRQALAVSITLPAELVALRNISLGAGLNGPPERAIEPANFAGFMNLRASYAVSDSFLGGAGAADGPVTVAMDYAVKVGGFDGVALRGEAFYNDDQGGGLVRGFTQLIRDDFDNAIRYTLGDLVVETSQFQAQPTFAGIAAERRYSDIQPFRQLQPSGSQEFLLRQNAIVDVQFNGVTTQTLNLPAGRYNLQDFAFFSGLNDVRLRILDETGAERFIEFSGFFAAQLLEKGLSEFSVASGFRSELNQNGGFDYTDEFIATGFYRWGATTNFTPEIGLQLSDRTSVANVGGVYGNELGSLDFAVAASTDDLAGEGWAASARLTTDFLFGDDVARFDLSTFVSDENFRTVEQIGPQAVQFEVSGRLGTPLPLDFFGSVGLRYTEFRDRPSDLVLGMTLNKSIGRFAFFATADFSLKGEFESRALLTVTTRFGQQGAARATVEPYTGAANFEIVNQPRQFAEDIGYRLSLQRSEGGSGRIDGEVTYRGNRFEALVTQRFNTRDEFTQFDGATTFASLGTALVFADDSIALSRPVFQNFAIVKKHPSLEDSTILSDEVDGRYTSRTDALGPAVVNDLNPYITRELNLSIEDRPAGYTIEDERPTVFPGVFDGYEITVGDEDYITLITMLVDETGEPLPLKGGEALYLDDPEAKQPTDLFTTSSGRAVLLRLRPGTYRLRLFGDTRQATITVSDDDGALQRVPSIVMEAPNE